MGDAVVEHVLRQLQDIGADLVFGVAGDCSLGTSHTVVEAADLRWVSRKTELSAAHAAELVGGEGGGTGMVGLEEAQRPTSFRPSYARAPLQRVACGPRAGVGQNRVGNGIQ